MKLKKLKGNKYEITGTLAEQKQIKEELSRHIQHYHLLYPKF